MIENKNSRKSRYRIRGRMKNQEKGCIENVGKNKKSKKEVQNRENKKFRKCRIKIREKLGIERVFSP